MTVSVRMAGGELTVVSSVSVMVAHVTTRQETAPVHLDTWVTLVTRVRKAALGWNVPSHVHCVTPPALGVTMSLASVSVHLV